MEAYQRWIAFDALPRAPPRSRTSNACIAENARQSDNRVHAMYMEAELANKCECNACVARRTRCLETCKDHVI